MFPKTGHTLNFRGAALPSTRCWRNSLPRSRPAAGRRATLALCLVKSCGRNRRDIEPASPLIDAGRLWSRLVALAEIGATPAGGVNRQALSDGEIEAWHLVIGWAREAGLEPATDAVGNLFLTLPGRNRHVPPLLLGSHLDTQPSGGKFDGAAGVLAAFEAVQSFAERGQKPDAISSSSPG